MVTSEKLEALAHLFLEKLSTLDIEQMLSIRTPGCTQHIGPDSMARPPYTNKGFSEAYKPMLAHFRSMDSEVVDMFTDTKRNVVTMHTKSKATTIAAPYDNEYIYFIYASPEGDRITKIEEYVDSARAQSQGAKLKEAIMAARKGI